MALQSASTLAPPGDQRSAVIGAARSAPSRWAGRGRGAARRGGAGRPSLISDVTAAAEAAAGACVHTSDSVQSRKGRSLPSRLQMKTQRSTCARLKRDASSIDLEQNDRKTVIKIRYVLFLALSAHR